MGSDIFMEQEVQDVVKRAKATMDRVADILLA